MKKTARKAARRAAAITEEHRRRIVDRNSSWDSPSTPRRHLLRVLKLIAFRLNYLTIRTPRGPRYAWFRKEPGTTEPSITNMREELANARALRLEYFPTLSPAHDEH